MSCTAARKNLQVARQQALNQLWMQVVTEEVLAVEDSGGGSALQDGESLSLNYELFILIDTFLIYY